MRSMFRFVLAVSALALSTGCESDCEKAYDHVLKLMEKNGLSKEKLEKAASAEERKEALDSDVDDILDEIDDVLESNAEDFVKSFIQKGGQ